jgi:cell division protein FtsL
MIRILNFFCFAVSALACLALYHVSEQTRMASVDLTRVNRDITKERSAMSVLQAEWARVADPARIQHLAEIHLGLTDTPTMELSSLKLLPRRGEAAPLGDAPVRNARVTVPAKRKDPRIRLAAAHPGT